MSPRVSCVRRHALRRCDRWCCAVLSARPGPPRKPSPDSFRRGRASIRRVSPSARKTIFGRAPGWLSPGTTHLRNCGQNHPQAGAAPRAPFGIGARSLHRRSPQKSCGSRRALTRSSWPRPSLCCAVARAAPARFALRARAGFGRSAPVRRCARFARRPPAVAPFVLSLRVSFPAVDRRCAPLAFPYPRPFAVRPALGGGAFFLTACAARPAWLAGRGSHRPSGNTTNRCAHGAPWA